MLRILITGLLALTGAGFGGCEENSSSQMETYSVGADDVEMNRAVETARSTLEQFIAAPLKNSR